MNPLFRHKKVLLLTGLMVLVSFLIAIISILLIYNNTQTIIYDRLTDIVRREKSAISVFINSYNADEKDIINHLALVRENDVSIGKNGEITFVKIENDSIRTLIMDTLRIHSSVPLKNVSLTTPMYLALNGKSGYLKAKDSDGIQVFAAYTYVEKLKWGIIAKIPTSEINKPYVKAAILVLILSLILISICIYAFLRITNPLIDSIIENEIQLTELNATKDKLFAIIAHDLRSPFNSIIGYSELLISNSQKFDSVTSEEFIEIINSSAKNTLNLLDNLLNWAKSQTGQISFRPEKINLSSLILGIMKISNSGARIKKITLNYIPSDEIELYADKNMLQLVLRNLISNALNFTKPNGKIDIYASHKNDNVEITVSDNGIGMNADTMGKLFRIDSDFTMPGTLNERGSGLGLILCKEFVEKHGGKIKVESEEGRGSDFKIILPLLKPTVI